MKLLTLACLAALLPAQVPWTMQRLPDTGQTRRYATAPGDDSQVTINPPRFATPSPAVATDLVTGLQWQRTDGGEMKWETAITYCQSLTLDGLSGWRLPFAQELFSIPHLGVSQPPLDTTVFTRTNAEYWWAIEPRAGAAQRFHARCVRHTAVGHPTAAAFTGHGDGAITDNRTGLIWPKDENPLQTWKEALGFANTLRLANYDDWRVPNSKELRSLHRDDRVRPSVDPAFFPGAALAPSWSSTTQIGILRYHPKTDRLRLRAVRAGGPVAEGEIIFIFGAELASGRQVFVNGAPATLVAWLAGQINPGVPPSVRGQPAATIGIDRNPAAFNPAAFNPAAFNPAAFKEDNTRHTTIAPAPPVEIHLDGHVCEILYAGLVPGLTVHLL